MKKLEVVMVLLMLPMLSASVCSGNDAPDPCANPDKDSDGFDAIECGGADCDDERALVRPSGTEVCETEVCDPSNIDEDCNATTFGDRDADEDGFVDVECCNQSASGDIRCGNDCNDTRPTAHPTSVETCNDIDDDCDTAIDEGVTASLYTDGDHDGYGAGAAVAGCFAVPGLSYLNNDCDDANAAIVPGEMKCLSATDYQICNNGAWSLKMTCPTQTTCRPQPNGTGVCI
jgi:hypothetical protein